jgi:hypothetical protein
LLFRKFPIEHVKAELVVPHILLMLNIFGWDVQVFDLVYSGSSCGVAVLLVHNVDVSQCLSCLFSELIVV